MNDETYKILAETQLRRLRSLKKVLVNLHELKTQRDSAGYNLQKPQYDRKIEHTVNSICDIIVGTDKYRFILEQKLHEFMGIGKKRGR